MIFFISYNVLYLVLLAFQIPITKYGVKFLGCCLCSPCARLQKKIDKTKKIHDNYYEYINLKYLLSEH